jgi:tRNA1(Val) A37 N6-methylase TrmN6
MVNSKMVEKIYQQYYTKSDEIVSYMLNKLALRDNSIVLEPCAGDGVLVDALLQKEKNIKIEAFEFDINEANKLKNKYRAASNVVVLNEDTLLYKNFINGEKNNKYDFIIANPPYGAWQDYEKRDTLKKIYPNLYVKETYTTFLYLCISLLKECGRLVFITPDTYLNLRMHAYIRDYILSNTLVEEIAIFASSFFPGVNFGYSKLSVITLVKNDNIAARTSNRIKIINDFKVPADLITENNNARITFVNQDDIIKDENHAFVYSDDKYLNKLLKFH